MRINQTLESPLSPEIKYKTGKTHSSIEKYVSFLTLNLFIAKMKSFFYHLNLFLIKEVYLLRTSSLT